MHVFVQTILQAALLGFIMNFILLWVCLGVVFICVIVFVVWLCHMAAEKRKEEVDEELTSRNRAAQPSNEADESHKNPEHIDDSNLPPVNNLAAFGEPLPPPPSYEEVVRSTAENLP